MKKGDKKTNLRTKKLIYELSLNEKFNNFIKSARKQLLIPSSGFKSDVKFNEWLDGDKENGMNLVAFDFEIQEKFGIPLTYCTIVSQYLCFGPDKIKIPRDPKIVIENIYSDDEGSLDELYKKTNVPFVKVYILGGSTKEQVVQELRDRWEEIERVFWRQGCDSRIVKEIKNEERDALIFDLYSKSRKDLGMKKGTYKEMTVARILREKYQTEISADEVKTIVKKQRKMRLGEFKFKF